MHAFLLLSFAALLLGLAAAPVHGAVTAPSFSPSPLVDHPVSTPHAGSTPFVWKQSVGKWGENFSEETLRLRGFKEVYEIKTASNQGIDRIAIKRAPDGRIRDVRIVETKTNRAAQAKLNITKSSGRQMSRKWIADRLRAMDRSGDPRLKSLAREIRAFKKSSDKQLPDFGEVHHINTRTARFRVLAADGVTVIADDSVERLLKKIQVKAGSAPARAWATRALAGWDQIRGTRMSVWLKDAQARGGAALFRTLIVKQGSKYALKRAMLRSAGPVGAVVALAVDAKELHDLQVQYQRGMISRRDRNIGMTTIGGGVAGAAVGAWGGAKLGVALGAFGGPFAWATMPIGGAVGLGVGGAIGYVAGSAVAGAGAVAWYENIDARTRDGVELGILEQN